MADALSRRADMTQDESNLQLNATAVSSVVPSWSAQVARRYEGDPMAQKLLHRLGTGEMVEDYKLTGGLIRFKGSVWLGSSSSL